jgi:hypothetical protein
MGGVVSGVGKLVGGGGGGKQRSQAEQVQADAFDYINNIRLPALEDLQINPSDITYYQVTGKLTPALYEAVQMDKTLLEDLEYNPDIIKDQMAGIQAKKERIAEGGLSIEDRARLNEVLQESGRQNKAQQETIAARLRERGAAGGAVEAMKRLQGQSQAADTTADNAFKTAALAATSKLQEEDKLQDLLGRLATQDIGVKGTRAQAEAERQKMNTSLLNQQALSNVNIQNAAQMANLQNQQRVSDANVGLANQGMLANKQAIQQNLANQFAKGNALSGASKTYSENLMDQGARRDAEKAGKWDSIGGFVDKGIGLGTAIFSDENLKTEINEADNEIDEMLEKLSPVSFKYKDQNDGEGKHTGIMAQDLEKSKAGKDLVVETEKGKAVDVKKALSAIMASQARLAKRLKDIEKKG